MKKDDVYLVAMITIFVSVGAVLYYIFTKFIPLFLYKTAYMCRQMVASISFQQIPHAVTLLLLVCLILYISYIALKIGSSLIYYIKQKRHFRKIISLHKDKELTSIVNKYPFLKNIHIISHNSNLAFSFGFLHRHIYISSKLLKTVNHQELEAILLHEHKHIKDFDSFKLFIAFVVETCLPFMPFLKELSTRMRLYRETLADTHAVSIQKTNLHILTSLRKILSHESPNYAYQAVFIPQFGPDNFLEARIASLTSTHNSTKLSISLSRLALSGFSLCVIIFLTITPLHAKEIIVDGENTMMACSESSPSCITICQSNASYMLKSNKSLR